MAIDLSGADKASVDTLYAFLRGAILRGEFAPGEVVSQVQLAKAFGISRTPLREALRMLQQEGLVDGEPNRRVRVASFSVEEMEHLYAARLSLEALGIRLSIPRFTSDDFAAMEAVIAKMAHFAEQQDYDRWELQNRALHAGLITYAGRRVSSLVEEMADHAARYRHYYMTGTAWHWGPSAEEHRAIVDAAKARDADTAAATLVKHHSHTVLRVIEMIEPGYDPVLLREAMAIAAAPRARD